ncbi:hypothetical protein MCERE19_04256 [Spirosomataceae bacterium]|jgi:hypothetical protein
MTINKYLKLISISVWKRIEFVWKTNNLRISETTITENLLFELWQKSSNIQFYEATDEKTNGNDIAIYLETSKGYIYLPTQAKRIEKSNRYTEIHHKEGIQRKNLIKHAGDKNFQGFPLYLLYSFNQHCNFPNYGCSFVDAEYIESHFPYKKHCKTPTFKDFIPKVAIPFDEILKISETTHELKLGAKITINSSDIKFHTLAEIKEMKNWRGLESTVQIIKKGNSKTDENDRFSPRYMLVFKDIMKKS